MKVKERAVAALAVAKIMKVFVRTLVGRAMHVAIVNGLNKYLDGVSLHRSSDFQRSVLRCCYCCAAISKFLSGRCKEARAHGNTCLRNLCERMGAQQVEKYV
jgi:hypothetical protein